VEPVNVFDYEILAQARIEPSAWNYYASGSDDEVTLRTNRIVFERIRLPPHMHKANFSDEDPTKTDAAFTWKSLAWLRSVTSLPIVLKGILTAEDALLAVKHRVDGIIVFNHGGRQLDSVSPSIEALPEVIQAVDGDCEVYLDGGIRRGTDILKALALGARAVLVGRPILWGLAVNGTEGVSHVLEILRAELELAMALAGRPTLDSIDRSLVKMI
jgi:isopentenyl diphosphate isomerase/L-lactate dehydrogenase-like FMN-dependent dehydrogenase